MTIQKTNAQIQLYQNEYSILNESKHLLAQKDVSEEVMRKAYALLVTRYESLLEEVRIHTKVGDKLQSKLYDMNEELEAAKANLEKIVEERTQELKQANIELLAINEELDSFVYRAAHDIRGPLATLLGLCNLAKMEIEDTYSLFYFDLILKTTKRLDNILSKLMIINKLKNTFVSPQQFRIQTLINEVINQYAYKNEIFIGVRFEVFVVDDFDLYLDKNILEILLYNLLENAAYTLTTPVNERIDPEIIQIKTVLKQTHFEIFVSHKGHEIPLEASDKIFNMFYRYEHSENTGLKLYTAKRATEKLKGRIWLVDSTKELTTFGVALPLSLAI
ncbi:sensor histidine kinase [Thermoflexibacter ruber]|uniref:histidine kinase n=1 Tax=Thermoflexibacter ruber TaxID=1003 RepID=A0A1I2AA56_9BACT|nr:HAMP domain-containing sensor histidine kinase [Thermoflexibacter ruber]SFE40934.1 Signal transduction histidine kinase [Thermoflexibacter ruber]